jgi:hypothetical protein
MSIVALVSEVASSIWTWIRAPSDTLQVGYEGSFLAYEFERLIPWAIAFIAMVLVFTMVDAKRSLR